MEHNCLDHLSSLLLLYQEDYLHVDNLPWATTKLFHVFFLEIDEQSLDNEVWKTI